MFSLRRQRLYAKRRLLSIRFSAGATIHLRRFLPSATLPPPLYADSHADAFTLCYVTLDYATLASTRSVLPPPPLPLTLRFAVAYYIFLMRLLPRR